MSRPFEGSYLGDGSKIADDTQLECGVCWWVYDPALGDEARQIAPGTPFRLLPDTWDCPALVEPAVMDATRCLSYLTIEHKGPIPDDWHEAIGPHVHGCDICQDVCPWNQHPAVSADPAWQPRAPFDLPTVDDLDALADDELRRALRGSAMKRTGIKGLRRNLDIAHRNLAR